MLNIGPPELPTLTAASVCRTSMGTPSTIAPGARRPPMCPALRLWPMPYGAPMMNTSSPTSDASESASFTGRIPGGTCSSWSTARSARWIDPTTRARLTVPSTNCTATRSLVWTTCAAVRTLPSAEISTPEPSPGSRTNPPCGSAARVLSTVRTSTTDALTLLNSSRSCAAPEPAGSPTHANKKKTSNVLISGLASDCSPCHQDADLASSEALQLIRFGGNGPCAGAAMARSRERRPSANPTPGRHWSSRKRARAIPRFRSDPYPPSMRRCPSARRCWNVARRCRPGARCAATRRQKARAPGCGGRFQTASPRCRRRRHWWHDRWCRAAAARAPAVAGCRREIRASPRAPPGESGSSEIPVQLQKEGDGRRRAGGGAADPIGTNVEVREYEPGCSAPQPQARRATPGRLHALHGRKDVHAAQHFDVGLQPVGVACTRAAVAERGGDQRIDLGEKDQGRPGRSSRRHPIGLPERGPFASQTCVRARHQSADAERQPRERRHLQVSRQSALAERVGPQRVVAKDGHHFHPPALLRDGQRDPVLLILVDVGASRRADEGGVLQVAQPEGKVDAAAAHQAGVVGECKPDPVLAGDQVRAVRIARDPGQLGERSARGTRVSELRRRAYRADPQ